MCLYQMLEDLQVTTMWFEVTIYTMYCIFLYLAYVQYKIKCTGFKKKIFFPMLKAKGMIYSEALRYIEFLRAIFNSINVFSM